MCIRDSPRGMCNVHGCQSPTHSWQHVQRQRFSFARVQPSSDAWGAVFNPQQELRGRKVVICTRRATLDNDMRLG
eukprot:10915174-Lingulodinium_polyedra.AAC.1